MHPLRDQALIIAGQITALAMSVPEEAFHAAAATQELLPHYKEIIEQIARVRRVIEGKE